MESQAAAARYNPFAFPSDTDFRFWLLIAVTLGASLLMYQGIANEIAFGGETETAVNDRCSARAAAAYPGSSFAQRESWLTVFNACTGESGASHAGAAAGVAVLVAGAVALYLLHPAWKRRRGRWVPLADDDAPQVVVELQALSRAAGLRSPPAFLWNPLNMAKSGVSFGTPQRRFVALTGGLTTTLWTDPDVFRAVILHELAHLRNGDVDKAYLTVAVWWSFVVVAMLPFALLTLRPGAAGFLSRTLSLAALTLVIYLLRNATLRARETFADVRASTWAGYADALDRILRPSPTPEPRGWRWVVAWARASLRMHPPAGSRREAVRDTRPLFRIGWWIAAGVGFAGSVTLLDVTVIVSQAVSAFVFAALVTGVVGLAVWRATFLAEARGEKVRDLTGTALALGIGFAAGDALSLSATVALPAGFALTGVALLLFDLVWYGLLFVGSALFLRWLAAAALTWLPAMAGRDSPRLAYLAGIALAVPVLAVGLWLLLTIEPLRFTGGQLSPSALAEAFNSVGIGVPAGPYLWAVVALAALALEVATQPALLAVAQLLWLVPLAPALWRGQMGGVSAARWAVMESGAPMPAGAAPPRLRLAMALIVAMAGGLTFWLLSLAIALVLSVTSQDALLVWIVNVQLAVGICVQVVVTAVVACRARSLGAVHGLFAGFVCGVVAAVATLAVTALVAGPSALRISGLVASTVIAFIGVAVLVTVPTAASAATLAGWIRRTDQPPASKLADAPAPLRAGSSTYAVGAVAAAVAILTVGLIGLGGRSPLKAGGDRRPHGGASAGSSEQQAAGRYRMVASQDALLLIDTHKSMRRACRTADAPTCRRAVVAVLSSADAMNRDMDRLQVPSCLTQADRDLRQGVALERGGAQLAVLGIDQLDRQEIADASGMLDQGLASLARAAPELDAC